MNFEQSQTYERFGQTITFFGFSIYFGQTDPFAKRVFSILFRRIKKNWYPARREMTREASKSIPSYRSLLAVVWFASCLVLATPEQGLADTLEVPAEYGSIQAAIDAAVDGDVVLVAPGIYQENLLLQSKEITLGSHFYTSGNRSFIDQTIIDGGGGAYVIQIGSTSGPATTIVGFTIQNADDGVLPYAKFDFLDNRITQTSDGIDYESGSGGLVQRSIFENNSDDGIDLDGVVEVTIEDSIIRNNDNDGIEIRLQPYTGPTIKVVIRNNQIYDNGQPDGNGIQLIEYTPGSSREFTIEKNIIAGNSQAGIGMMCCQQSNEDFQGASLLETVFVFNNTFAGNDHGITGGDNTVVVNNIFLNTTNIALKRVDGNSIAAYNIFHNNGTDASESNLDSPTLIYADPELDPLYKPAATSPAVDAGTASYTWNTQLVLDLTPGEYMGSAPELGAVELQIATVPAIGAWGLVALILAILGAVRPALRQLNQRG